MIQLPIGYFCSIECALSYTSRAQEKAREKQLAKAGRDHREKEKAVRKAVRELNKHDVRWQHKKTQQAFNKMRVLEEMLWFKERGKKPTCISCGQTKGNDQWCCGHFKTVGAHGVLRYDRNNTYLQHNRRCNMGLSGDIGGTKTTRGYKQGLKERFGEDEGQAIIDYCESKTEVKKWEWQELESMRKQFNCRIREISILL